MTTKTKSEKTAFAAEVERMGTVRIGFQINLTASEKVALVVAAQLAGKPIATFIREAALKAARYSP